MFGLGFFELTLFGIIALIVLGPEKLPVAARTLGRWYGMFRNASTRLQNEISSELNFLEVQEELKQELAKIRESEAQIKSQMADLQRSLNRGGQSLRDDIQGKSDGAHEPSNHSTADNKPQGSADDAAKATSRHQNQAALNIPLTNRWFRLSDYDRKRRLPDAPRLPNYRADPLLHTLTDTKHHS